MMQKKHLYLIISIFILVLFLSPIYALTGNSSQILYAENAIGYFQSSINSTLSTNYKTRTAGINIVGMYVFEEGFGRFGILGTTSAHCGNGVIELTETCDNGALNGIVCSPACETTCAYCDSGCITQSVTGATCGGDGDCFIAGTQILMANGNSKNIEDIKIGDLIKTLNTKNMQIENNLVLELTSPIHNNMIILEFEDAINTNTFDHPYFIKNKGWASYKPTLTLERYKIEANQLEIGDTAYFFDKELKESKLLSIKKIIKKTQTYNLHEVFENNNFFANGILVHNKGGEGGCTDECTESSTSNICKNSTTIETKICGNFDADTCTEWGNISINECLGGCVDGECLEKCISEWDCEEWGECIEKTNANSVLQGGVLLGDAHQERKCTDINNCQQPKVETTSCANYEKIGTRTTEWCDENYVELFETQTNKVVGKIKQQEFLGISTIKRVDINFEIADFTGYCSYCFDKIKNHDETDIDCGGPSCPECIKPKKYIDWIIYVIVLSWIMLMLLLSILGIEKREEIMRILKFIKEKILQILESAKFKSTSGAELERKILLFLKKLFGLPFRITEIKFSNINILRNRKKTGPYKFQKIETTPKEKQHKRWLKKSIEDIKKKKRRGFLGEEGSITEAKRELERRG